MDRRRFLTSTGVAVTIGIAGCGGQDGEGGGEGDGEGNETGGTNETGGGMNETDGMNETGGEMNETNQTDGNETGNQTAGGGAGTTEVQMVTEGSDYYFDPIGLFVEPGTTVTFVNEAGSHSSTAYAEGNSGAETTLIPQDAEAWDSGILSEEGATFEHTFEVEGTYDYFCSPHKSLGMVGRIVVGSPGGPAEGQQPPDGDVPESQQIVDQESISWQEFQGQ